MIKVVVSHELLIFMESNYQCSKYNMHKQSTLFLEPSGCFLVISCNDIPPNEKVGFETFMGQLTTPPCIFYYMGSVVSIGSHTCYSNSFRKIHSMGHAH